MYVTRNEGHRRGNSYNVDNIPESTMITIIEGVQKKLAEYRKDSHDPKFSSEEDQEFLNSMEDELSEFLRETRRFIILSEDGKEMQIRP